MAKLLIIGDPKGSHTMRALKKGWAPEDITVWENDKRHAYAIKCISDKIDIILDDNSLSKLNECAMKFDAVIGNPPYNVDNNPSFYVKFIVKAKELVKEGGHINLIVPNRFLDPGSKAGRELVDLNMIEINANVNHHFPTVNTQIAAFHATTGEPNSKCKMVFEKEEKVIDWDYTKPMPIQTTSYLSAMIVDKVFSHPGEKLVATKEGASDNYLFIDSAYERYHHLKSKGGEKTPISRVNMNNTGIIKNGSGNYYAMDSREQAELNAWFISRSMIGRFCALCFANSAQVNFRNIARMNKLKNVEMDDQVLYNMFNLTQDEITHLEGIMNSKKNIT